VTVGCSRRKYGRTEFSGAVAVLPGDNCRLTIHLYPATVTQGRGGILIQCGSNPGRAGCIVLTTNMDDFVEKLKQELKGLPECYVALNVDYSKKR
jgi:hypothetical protein